MKKKFIIGVIALLFIFPMNVGAKSYSNVNYNMIFSDNIDQNIILTGFKPIFEEYKVFADSDECSNIFGGKFGKQLKQILNIIKFFVPIIIIILAIVDLVKAIASQSQDDLKKAATKFVKRLIIGTLIFVLPTILEFILKLAGIEFGVCTLG